MAEVEITVEAALAELREMFPYQWLSVEAVNRGGEDQVYAISVSGLACSFGLHSSLVECMNEVRTWKDSQ